MSKELLFGTVKPKISGRYRYVYTYVHMHQMSVYMYTPKVITLASEKILVALEVSETFAIYLQSHLGILSVMVWEHQQRLNGASATRGPTCR